MAKKLRDYECKYCSAKDQRADDEEHLLCAQCGSPGLELIDSFDPDQALENMASTISKINGGKAPEGVT